MSATGAGMQVHEPDAVITAQERQEAEQTAERIRQGLESVAPLVERAWRERHWEKLGYQSWADYVAGEFGEHRIGARRAVAALLAGEGLSVRQIAVATGVPRSTVSDDLRAKVSDTPDTDADQPKRNAGVTRPKAPKTGAQRAAEHRERKRGQESPQPSLSASELARAAAQGPAKHDTGRQQERRRPPCEHEHMKFICACGHEIPGTWEEIEWRESRLRAELGAEISQRDEQIAALRAQLAERDEQLARLQEAQIGPGLEDPGSKPSGPGTPADSGHANGRQPSEASGPCQHPVKCGNPGRPCEAELPDGRVLKGVLCDDCLGREAAKDSDVLWSRPELAAVWA